MISLLLAAALIFLGLLSYRHSLRIKGNDRIWEQARFLAMGVASIVLGGLWLVGLGISAALASTDTPPVTSIDLTQIVLAFIGLVGAAITAIGSVGVRALARYLERKAGLAIDAETRAYLERAVTNGVAWAIGKASDRMNHAAPAVDLRNEAIALAVRYVLDRVPDALAHFGITEAGVRQLVEARLLRLLDVPASIELPPAA